MVPIDSLGMVLDRTAMVLDFVYVLQLKLDCFELALYTEYVLQTKIWPFWVGTIYFVNYSFLQELLIASRNLEFFTNGYRYVIQVLPAAVVAPMYFSGKIEFGVINQSYSAFNHILSDFSIIIYQFQALSAFSAVIDRLGRFIIFLKISINSKDLSFYANFLGLN